MAMFSSGSTESPAQGGRPTKEPGLSILAAGMKVVGEVDSNGVVKIEGGLAGSVKAAKQVLVAKGGLVEGDILTKEAIIGGEVRGAIYADERVEVQSTCVIHGDITTQRIVVQEGGEVNGRVRMSNPDALSRKTAGGPPREKSNQEVPTKQGTPQAVTR